MSHKESITVMEEEMMIQEEDDNNNNFKQSTTNSPMIITKSSSSRLQDIFLYTLLAIFILASLIGLALAFVDFSFPDQSNTSNRFLSGMNQVIIDLPVEAFMMIISIGCLCIAFMIFMWIGLKRRNNDDHKQDETEEEEWKQLKDKLEVDSMVLAFTRQFIKKQIKYLIPFIIIVGSLLIGFDQTNLYVTNSICFILGCFVVMLVTYVNGLISNSNSSVYNGREIIGLSIRFGSVIGFLTLGVSLVMLMACFLLFSNMNAVLSFVLGCSSISLIGQLSGSVFQKSADITMNLFGHYINSSTTGQEEILTIDHKRNPIIIAKIVGEHIGGIVAYNTDIMQSFVAMIVLSSIIGSQYFGTNGVSLPFYLVIINILTAVIGIAVAAIFTFPSIQPNNEDNHQVEKKISKSILKCVLISGAINMVLVLALTFTLFDVVTQGWAIFSCYLIGFLNGGVLVQFLFRYYSFHRYRPVQYLALNSTSWYHYVSSGYSHSVLSLIIPILSIIVNIILCSALSTFMTGGRANGSLFGLTISGIGMSANIIFFLGLDTIVPNMNIRHLDKKETRLDSTLHTYFLTNGSVNRGCQLTITLFFCLSAIQFLMVKSGLMVVNVVDLSTLIGLIFGLVMPFIIIGLLWSNINYCSMQMINECKGQLREIDGLLEGKPNSRPNYENMNRLQSVKSIRGVVMITSIIFLSPTLIGLIGRPKMLLSFLVSFSLVGYILSYIMLNLGFSWNSLRRIVESKQDVSSQPSDQHLHMDIQNAIVADTIGMPLRDSLAPSLLSIIRVVTLVCLVIAPTLKLLYP